MKPSKKSKPNTSSVYGLVCPIKKEIVYVGVALDVQARIVGHINEPRNTSRKSPLLDYFRRLIKKGVQHKVKAVILASDVSTDKRNLIEREWIIRLSATHNLLNRVHAPKKQSNIMSIEEYEIVSGKSIK